MKRLEVDMNSPSYTPNRLLNHAAQALDAKTDAFLSAVLACDPALLCHIRKKKHPVSAWLMVRIMDRTGWHIGYVRELAGMPFDDGMAA